MAKAKIVTDMSSKYFTNNKINIGSAAPTTGAYKAGDMVISSSPNSTAFGWICTAAGTPGTWKVLQSGVDASAVWGNVTGKPSTYTPVIGTTSTTAFRGDYGNIAYTHSQSAHAPSNAQKNSDITKAEIEAVLLCDAPAHSHEYNQVLDTRYLNEPPSKYILSSTLEFKKKDVINNPPGGSNIFSTVKTVKGWTNNSGGNSHQLSLSCNENSHDPYIAIRTAPNENNTWGEWYSVFTSLNKPTCAQANVVATTGDSMSGNLSANGIILWNNSTGTGLKGYTTGGSQYHIMGVDGSNNIYLGWENQTYVNINNTVRCYRDIHMQSTFIYTDAMRVDNGSYSSIGFGPTNVRLEYSKGDGLVYVAGSETAFNGHGTPFRAKHLESVENYIKVGSNWFTISSSAPGYGGIWFQN